VNPEQFLIEQRFKRRVENDRWNTAFARLVNKDYVLERKFKEKYFHQPSTPQYVDVYL
jgi:hypothetical protein